MEVTNAGYRKPTAATSYDYTAYKRSLECLFGLGVLGKSGVSLCGGNWASKLPAVIGIRLYGAALKRDTNGSAMVKQQLAAH
ncbi:hypothetical protein TNCV_3468861 [Trichonephila clavipes]|nr:hypothetical protein TNCV_3468861 [Trichonephila clavipes]